MSVASFFIEWFGRNWQWTVSFFLLLTTIAISSQSYITQIRSGVREALEQLDADDYGSNGFVRLILHDYAFLQGRTKVALKFQAGRSVAGISEYKKPESVFESMRQRSGGSDTKPTVEEVETHLGTIDGVYSVDITDYEIIVGYKARKPVDVRRIGEECIRALHIATHPTVDDY